MNRTDRLIGILLELQARGERRAEDLAGHFEVSVRTIYRDVQALCEDGVPVIATPGKGYRLMDGYFLPPLTFTESEAALLVLGGEFVRERVDSELRRAGESALAKLASVLPPDRRAAVERWRRQLLFVGAGAVDSPWLPSVRLAVQAQRVVRVLYHTPRHDAAGWREVEPVCLTFLSGAWYLAGYCRLRRAPRLFRLDRIDQLEIADERFDLADRHAVGPEYAERRGDFVEIRVRFDPSVIRWARERQPYIFLREEPEPSGPIFVYMLRDARELLAWLLSWGANVEVLSPPSFRARLAREAAAIVARHTVRGEFGESAEATSAPAITVSGAVR